MAGKSESKKEILKRPGETAKTLQVSGMTLRNYVKHFSPLLSETATRNTGRQFTEKDIGILKRANSLLSEGLTYGQVLEKLEGEKTLEGEVLTDEDWNEAPAEETETPGMSLQVIEFLEMFIEQTQGTIEAKDELISELRNDKERLEGELKWLRLPWYRRLFTKPPE